MKKVIIGLFLLVNTTSRADLFGGDVAVLTQILAQAIMQLSELKNILSTASDEIDLIRKINEGINDSLNILRTIDPNADPGIYKDWQNAQEALGKLQSIYGITVNSPEAQVQRDTDQQIAEAVSYNNNYYKWTRQLDEIGESIKSQSHDVSPGGAQKLTAQALGLLIQVMNQNIRAQATQMKLQAQGLAIQNKNAKEETKHFLSTAQGLKTAMQNEKIQFQVPRF